MALREFMHPFGQPWSERAPAKRLPKDAARREGVVELPPPQLVGWPERPAPRARQPQDELADIIGYGSGSRPAVERSARAFFAEPAARAAADRDVDAWMRAPAPPMPKAQRRAMYATIAVLVLGTLTIGAQLVYYRLLMPVPAELAGTASRGAPSSARPPPVLPTLPADPKPSPPDSDALSALAPNAADSLVALAWLQIRAGDPGRAYVYAQRATLADPSDEKTWAVLERTLDALRDPARAQDAYRKCVSANPSPFAFACSRLLK